MSSVTNADRTLTYIDSLIEKRYGARVRGVVGMCLVTQVLYSVRAQTGISIRKQENALERHRLDTPYNGATFQQVCDPLTASFGLTFTAKRLHKVAHVIKTIDAGRPVITVVDSCSKILPDYANYHGVIADFNVRCSPPVNQPGNKHAVLTVGIDRSEQMLIIRESRNRYGGCNGYAKVSIASLKRWPQSCAFIDLVAHLTKPVRKGTIPSL